MKAIGSEMKEHERENVEEDEGSGKDLRCREAKMVLHVIRTCSGNTNMFLQCSQFLTFPCDCRHHASILAYDLDNHRGCGLIRSYGISKI